MTETRFTPGPWGINKYGGVGMGHDGLDKLILSSGAWMHDCTPEDQERRNGDMHLIAAAPELYRLLEQFVSKGHSATLAEEACAALRQARGETE